MKEASVGHISSRLGKMEGNLEHPNNSTLCRSSSHLVIMFTSVFLHYCRVSDLFFVFELMTPTLCVSLVSSLGVV